MAQINFYKHHLGDYSAATAHLSWDEDCAYRRLLDAYYKREQPIPVDVTQACRLARAMTPAQRKAVKQVLDEFFVLEDDGWHQKRCDEEIAEANEIGSEREAKAENERERQRRHREERKTLFEKLRDFNVVPPFETTTSELRKMLSERTSNADVTVTGAVTSAVTNAVVTRDNVQPVTRTATANQTPDSISQTPDLKPTVGTSSSKTKGIGAPASPAPRPKRLDPRWKLSKANGDWALALRPDWTPDDVRKVAEQFRDHWIAKGGKDASKLDWDATWRNWVRQETKFHPPKNGAQVDLSKLIAEFEAEENAHAVH